MFAGVSRSHLPGAGATRAEQVGLCGRTLALEGAPRTSSPTGNPGWGRGFAAQTGAFQQRTVFVHYLDSLFHWQASQKLQQLFLPVLDGSLQCMKRYWLHMTAEPHPSPGTHTHTLWRFSKQGFRRILASANFMNMFLVLLVFSHIIPLGKPPPPIQISILILGQEQGLLTKREVTFTGSCHLGLLSRCS